MVTSSTTATSFTACAVNPWRCSTWSIVTRCSRARPIVWPGKSCWRTAIRAVLAKQWCRCWRWRMSVAARPNLPGTHRTDGSRGADRRCGAAGSVRAGANKDARCRRQPAAGRQLRSAPPVAGSRSMNDSTSDTIKVDTARLPLLLRELRLPTIAAMWQGFTERADREGWPAARLLATLTELELAERDQRRIQRHLLEARLPSGKTLDSFDFAAVPMLSRAHVAALATGDGWIDRGGTILLFGPS